MPAWLSIWRGASTVLPGDDSKSDDPAVLPSSAQPHITMSRPGAPAVASRAASGPSRPDARDLEAARAAPTDGPLSVCSGGRPAPRAAAITTTSRSAGVP